MNVFVGMEESQVIQQAFEARGHNAWSCDLKPGRVNPSRHLQGDVFEMIKREPRGGWDLVILHPVCRLLSVSGQHWNGKPGQRTHGEVEEAVSFFMRCVELAMQYPKAMIENPVSIMSTRYRQPDQIIQPNWFGDDASKATCLWLFNLEPLTIDPSEQFPPRVVEWKGKLVKRWGNQTDSGHNRLGPTADPEYRRAARAVTYPGTARAFASRQVMALTDPGECNMSDDELLAELGGFDAAV
jgi:hypothetical protein